MSGLQKIGIGGKKTTCSNRGMLGVGDLGNGKMRFFEWRYSRMSVAEDAIQPVEDLTGGVGGWNKVLWG